MTMLAHTGTARVLTPSCTGHMAGIGVLMARFRRESGRHIHFLTSTFFRTGARPSLADFCITNFPGLINSIKAKAHIGTAGEHLFYIAYFLGVSSKGPLFSQVWQVELIPQN